MITLLVNYIILIAGEQTIAALWLSWGIFSLIPLILFPQKYILAEWFSSSIVFANTIVMGRHCTLFVSGLMVAGSV